MELNDYVRILRAHWVGVALLTVLGVLAALAFNLTQTKVYAANANGFVSSGTSSDPALGSIGDSLAKSRAKSYVDIATSRATAADVVKKLGLDASPASLIGRIAVNQPTDTVLIKITARASTPKSAQQLADAWVASLADQVAKIENPTGKTQSSGLRLVPVESAALPSVPILPRTKFNLLIGLLVGAMLGVAYATIRNQFDRRIKYVAKVERTFNVAVMGVIPQESSLFHKYGDRATIAVLKSSRSSKATDAEAFRKLRTNLSYMDVDHPPRRIVVTSPQEGDGKSTVAANLAAAIAVTGQSVVLIDADLRRPTVAESFGLAEGVGLTDLLINRVDTEDATQVPAKMEHLRILAAGRIPPNPSELLGSQSMRTLLEKLSEDAIVIVDAPPLLPVTDAAVLTAISDGALVVISAGKTLDTELGAALSHLESVNGRALGVVFNRMTGAGEAAGYYGAGYYFRPMKNPA